MVARGRLRELLGQQLGADPASLAFQYGEHGKPCLSGSAASADLKFNLSHSRGFALLGICAHRELGVDIEFWRSLRDEEALARRYFAAPELQSFLSLPALQRTEGFFNCWTRKEAYIKALGRGLSLPLSGFTVSLRPGEDARLISGVDMANDRRWNLAAITVFDQCSAAMVIEGDGCHIVPANDVLLDSRGRRPHLR